MSAIGKTRISCYLHSWHLVLKNARKMFLTKHVIFSGLSQSLKLFFQVQVSFLMAGDTHEYFSKTIQYNNAHHTLPGL